MRADAGIVDPEWYRVVLKDGRPIAADEAYIRDMFNRAFANRNKPGGMSLWMERRHDGGTVYYLSPVSVTREPGLAHHLGAVRSAHPPATAYLIAGSQARDA